MAPELPEAPIRRLSPARLIPTAGIKGQEEQEKRATSALLAVLTRCTEFTQALLKDLGAPKGRNSDVHGSSVQDATASCPSRWGHRHRARKERRKGSPEF
jgi:hypothetical protein